MTASLRHTWNLFTIVESVFYYFDDCWCNPEVRVTRVTREKMTQSVSRTLTHRRIFHANFKR